MLLSPPARWRCGKISRIIFPQHPTIASSSPTTNAARRHRICAELGTGEKGSSLGAEKLIKPLGLHIALKLMITHRNAATTAPQLHEQTIDLLAARRPQFLRPYLFAVTRLFWIRRHAIHPSVLNNPILWQCHCQKHGHSHSFSSAGWAFHRPITWSKCCLRVCLDVCLDVNRSGTNRITAERRLVILHAQTY